MKKLILILMLLGCSDPSPPDVTDLNRTYCTVNFTDDEKVLIQAAMDEWNDKTGITAWRVSDSCNSIIEKVEHIEDDNDLVGKTYWSNNSKIEVEAVVTGDWLRAVVLHELGHVAHLGHTSAVEDCMSPPTPAGQHLTEGDLAEFHRVNW